MKPTKKDYSKINTITELLGLVRYRNRFNIVQEGFYTFSDLHAPIDLTACAEDEISILKTAVRQLAKQADNTYHNSLEKDLGN